MFVPLERLLSPEHFPVATTELFGPFQVGLKGIAGLTWRLNVSVHANGNKSSGLLLAWLIAPRLFQASPFTSSLG